MREVEAAKERDAMDRKAFKQLQEQDRKLLYKQYRFSDSEEEDSDHADSEGPISAPPKKAEELPPEEDEEVLSSI